MWLWQRRPKSSTHLRAIVLYDFSRTVLWGVTSCPWLALCEFIDAQQYRVRCQRSREGGSAVHRVARRQ